MSTTRKINGNTYYVKCNGHVRDLRAWAELEHSVIGEWFGEDYLTDECEQWTPRFFEYRGSWYDSHEFERAGDNLRALGFDGVQRESAFSAVALRYFDIDGYEYGDGVVVGYVHW